MRGGRIVLYFVQNSPDQRMHEMRGSDWLLSRVHESLLAELELHLGSVFTLAKLG